MTKTTRRRCVAISRDEKLLSRLTEVLGEYRGVEQLRPLREYPDETALRRLMLFGAPDIIFVDAGQVEGAIAVAQGAEKIGWKVQLIAVCDEHGPILGRLMRAGVREYVDTEIDRDAVYDAIIRCNEAIEKKPEPVQNPGQVISFLPAKAGAGASTIAANTSLALSRITDVRVLLADFDTGAGVQGFIFKLNHSYSLKDALDSAHDLEETLWQRLAARHGDLDILPADCALEQRFDFEKVTRLLDYLRRAYTVTCLDLPGTLDAVSIEAMRESRKIYLVCTQELTCLHVLRKRAELLRSLGLEEKLRLLVNRYDQNHVMNADRIAEVAGLKVEGTLPNDYKQTLVGTGTGTMVDPKGALSAAFDKIAYGILRKDLPKRPAKRRFIDFFAIPSTKGGSLGPAAQ